MLLKMWKAFMFIFIFIWIKPGQAEEEEWWKTASVYQIYPYSLFDSDSDGFGDFRGISSPGLGHIGSLGGVDAVWLTPIFQSPMKDFGYDVSDYLELNPIFGDWDDFQALLDEAKYRGLKVILDFVPNHTSDQHQWFLKSVAGEAPYTDYYVWADPSGWDGDTPLPPNNWLSKVRTSAWEWSRERGQFYYHQYQAAQPDLNYRNRLVIEEMKRILSFWLELDGGIKGVRLDAISHLIEDERLLDEPESHNPEAEDELDWNYLEHIYTNNQNLTRDLVAELTKHVKKNFGSDTVVILETDLSVPEVMDYYSCGDIPFNFNLARHLNSDISAEKLVTEIELWLDNMPQGAESNWVTGSHDISRVGSRVGEMFIDHLNMLLLMLPGVSVTYQGEELGMTDTSITWEDTLDPAGLACGPDRYQECSRDPQRTPFQWNDQDNAGFSQADKTWLPVNENYHWLNIEAQRALPDHNSHYWVYVDTMWVRRNFLRDNTKFFTAGNTFIALNENWVLLLNFSNSEKTINLTDQILENGFTLGLAVVSARSVDGQEENKFGSQHFLSEDFIIGSFEAILLTELPSK